MGRVQLAINVTDLGKAIDFYGRMFGAEPAKVRPGYANFAIEDPPLKLVLIENGAGGGTLNHLGVEVGSTDEVEAADRRVRSQGLPTLEERNVTCCYAVQDKVWMEDPDGARWEYYTVLADATPAAQADPCADGCDCSASG